MAEDLSDLAKLTEDERTALQEAAEAGYTKEDLIAAAEAERARQAEESSTEVSRTLEIGQMITPEEPQEVTAKNLTAFAQQLVLDKIDNASEEDQAIFNSLTEAQQLALINAETNKAIMEMSQDANKCNRARHKIIDILWGIWDKFLRR
jgi:predicted DNA binding protein